MTIISLPRGVFIEYDMHSWPVLSQAADGYRGLFSEYIVCGDEKLLVEELYTDRFNIQLLPSNVWLQITVTVPFGLIATQGEQTFTIGGVTS